MLNKFTELGLGNLIVNALSDLGFDTPTPIQAQAIPHILNSDQDLVALAQTGTGKTAAFGLPVLQKINPENRKTQAIILCPTRELCLQIYKDLVTFSKFIKGMNVVAVFGGSSISMQIRDLNRGAQIIVGTPGRVQDLINRGSLNISEIQWLVLDEADEMLNMGFKEELDEILKSTPKSKRTLLFSATMPTGIAKITKQYMSNPFEISVGEKNAAAKKIKHVFYSIHERDRYQALVRVLDFEPNVYGIVFCRTRMETQEVASKLMQDGYSAEAIHGDISQDQRTKVMNRFRKRSIQLLVATDVAARGIDVKDLSHVINYNLPDSLETYTHRSGRTGRADQSGVSIVIINMKEKRMLNLIEKRVGIRFEKLLVPKADDIVNKKLSYLLDQVNSAEVMKETEEYMNTYLLGKNIDYKEIALRLLNLQIKEVVTKYAAAGDINSNDSGAGNYDNPRRNKFEKTTRNTRSNDNPRSQNQNSGPKTLVTVSLTVGKKDGFGIKDLFRMINSQKSLRNVEIGQIDLGPNESTFEIDAKFRDGVVNYLPGSKFKGKPINVKII